jgi:hypothetical protein
VRISDHYLESVFYLYPDQDAAEKGQAIGGTGFFASNELGEGLGSRLYAVTNRHVIEAGNVVLRINTRVGEIDSFDTDERLWVRHPQGDDLAILPLTFDLDNGNHVISHIPRSLFFTPEEITEYDIGIGDETFSVGRVINQEGKQRNTPTVRFGNIAQMPSEPVTFERNGEIVGQVSFLIEARSISGYSGAPVFTFVPPSSVRGVKDGHLQVSAFSHMIGPGLLGINWAHMNDFVSARDKEGRLLPYKVQSNSGMMAAVPAWKLAEMFDMPEIRKDRAIQQKRRESSSGRRQNLKRYTAF